MQFLQFMPLLWAGFATACAQAPADIPVNTTPVSEVSQMQTETQVTAQPPIAQIATQAETQPVAVASQAWPSLMQNYLTAPDAAGLVRIDYAGIQSSPAAVASLDNYIAFHEGLAPSQMNAAAATAYWANLYNALTVKVVVDNYPVKSIRKISSGPLPTGPWKKDVSIVEGEDISLDKIEHGIMRQKFPSPLIHYMVNCASVGCPNLIAGEWQISNLDADRDQAARDFINSPRGARITSKGLVVSSIYKWFDEDFGGSKEGVLNHLRQYANADLAAAIDGGAKITGYDYDWTLNGVGHE